MGRSEDRLRRRTFLKALSVGLAAPVAWRMTRMATAAPGDRPTRLFIYFIPHGVPVEHYEPFGAGMVSLGGSRILAPLEPYASKVNILRGVSMNDGATNHAAIEAVLTGFDTGEGTQNSIDKIVADGLGATPHVIGAIPFDAGWGFGHNSQLVKHGAWVVPTYEPADVVNELFEGAKPEPPEEDDEVAFRRAALELSERELEGLAGELSELSREQSKLALHLEAVRAIKEGGGGSTIPQTCMGIPELPAVNAAMGLDPLAHQNFGVMVNAHLEASAHAMLCGSAQVITMQNMWVNSTVNMDFAGGPGIPKAHHDPISHSWDAAGRDEFAECQRWFFERLATQMLAVLDTPDPSDTDPNRTVLDNSLIYVCSEICDGANHNSQTAEVWIDGQPHPTYLPLITIGGAGGGLTTGKVFDLARDHTDVLATIAAAMNVQVGQLGDQEVSVVGEMLG